MDDQLGVSDSEPTLADGTAPSKALKSQDSAEYKAACAFVEEKKKVMKKSQFRVRFDELSTEIDWLEKEYRSFMADSYGLFTWKTVPGQDTPRPFFRLESESKIRKLQERMEMFSRWEASFTMAFGKLEREFSVDKR